MKFSKIYCAVLSLLVFQFCLIAQDDGYYDGQIEIFLIDSYVTPELPHEFVVSFFTSDSTTSKLSLDNRININISDRLTDQHSARINIMQYEFDTTIVPFVIEISTKNGDKILSENYELSLPAAYELKTEKNVSLFTVCCFGGVVFLLPSPTLVAADSENYFALSKEIPILSFYSKGYNYPVGYAGIEYEYVFNAPIKNIFRVGYKHIFQVPYIEYISPGFTGYSDLLGNNGISGEINFGILKVYSVFTLFTKYRFNWFLSKSGRDLHEVSIGLYSNFFSFNF